MLRTCREEIPGNELVFELVTLSVAGKAASRIRLIYCSE